MKQNTIHFRARDRWSVADLYRFFLALNVLYNRLYVFHFYFKKDFEALQSSLINSLNYIEYDDELKIDKIIMESPANISLDGVGEIIKQLREIAKDITYRNRIEKEMLLTELLNKQVDLMKNAGFSDDEIKEVISKFFAPINRLKKQIDKNHVNLIERREDKDK